MIGWHVPQPDINLRVLPAFGGQSSKAGEYGAGTPRGKVREYLTVLLNPRKMVWRELMDGRYRDIQTDADSLLRSRLFPGLRLAPEALWNGARLSPEHAAFVERLASARRQTITTRVLG